MTGCRLEVAFGRADVHAVLAQAAGPGRQVGVGGGEHAALAGGEELARVERPGGQRRRPHRPAHRDTREPAAQAASSTSAMPRRSHSRRSGSTSAGMPPWCDDDDGPGALGEDRARRSPREVARPRARRRRRPGVAPTYTDAVGGGDEREGRHDDLVARPDPEQVQARCRPVVHDDTATACSAPDACGEARLELGDPRALGDPAGAHGLGGGRGLLLAEPRLHHGDHRRYLALRAPPVDEAAAGRSRGRSPAVKPSRSLRRRDRRQPAGHPVDGPLRAELDRQVARP